MTATVTFTLPRTLLVNANQRLHWAQKAARTRGLRQLAAMHTNRPPFPTPINTRQHITITYTFTDRRAVRDIANLHPSSKALVDGLQDSGVLRGDDDAHVLGPDNRLGQPDKTVPPGRVLVTITLQDTT